MNIPLADYQDERSAFEALLNSDCENRILLFRGESGSGKTSLLQDCHRRAGNAPSVRCVNINLKGNAVTVAEIFSRAASKLERQSLTNFRRQMAELLGIPEINIDNNQQTGYNHQINVILQDSDPSIREMRRALMTDALFADMKRFEHQVLFVLDTYEQATSEVQEWLSGPFLARVAEVIQVRTLVAGQKVPDERTIDWGHCCRLHELRGVREATHWMPVVQAMRRRIPAAHQLDWLGGVCHVYHGRPSEIMKVIEALPLEESAQ